MNLDQIKQELTNRTIRCWQRARELWPDFRAPLPEITFTNDKSALGLCWGSHKIAYNLGYAVQGPHVLDFVVPHEVAHAVVNYFGWDRIPGRIRRSPHGMAWKRVCIALGGNGEIKVDLAKHNMVCTKGSRRVTKYEYRASCGTVIMLSAVIHGKIQRGQMRRLNSTKGVLSASSFTGQIKSD